MNKQTTLSAPAYASPVCKTIDVRVQQRILSGSPISAVAAYADEDDYGEF